MILLVIDLFLFLLLCATIAGGFFAAKVFAQQVKETDEAKVQAMYAKAEQAEKVNIPNALRSYTAERLTDQEAIPAYSISDIYSLDLRKPSGVTAADLELVTSDGLVGLE